MSMKQSLIRRLDIARARENGEDGIALMLVTMVVLVVASLSVLALGAITVQAKPTQFERKDLQTINAAEAGLDAALATIRNATYIEGVAVYGDRAQLPCWTNYLGQVVSATGLALNYAVTIQYFKTDPSQQTPAWRLLNALSCLPGIGTAITPSEAYITSSGTGPALPGQAAAVGNRTIQSVYTFSTTNPNLPGGLIKDPNGLCYAGTATTGGAVTLQTCLAGADTQMWAYTSTFLLVLTSTRNADGSGGMCLSANPGTASKINATMQPCAALANDYTQKWGVNGSDPVHFFGHLTANYNSTWCLGAVTVNSVGSPLSADNSTCGTGNKGVYPQASVGAGAAGTTTTSVAAVDGQPLQWVNYQEFGRCFDDTSWNLNTRSEIVYPCKQDPMLGAVSAASPGWNEVFTWSSTNHHFWLNAASSSGVPSSPPNPAYCMRSPGTSGGYVTFSTLCSSITTAMQPNFTWTVNRDTGSTPTSYTIVDSFGRCLSNGPANPSNASAYSSVITATCDGGSGEKWNAPPNLGSASVTGISEIPNH